MEELPPPFFLEEGPVRLPADAELVTDADEEVFLLYTALQRGSSDQGTSQGFHGLGQVDARKDTLRLQLEIGQLTSEHRAKSKRRREASQSVEIMLAQDTTALRSRKGDTGSVLWMASVVFAQLVLRQNHAHSETSLLRQASLVNSDVLELGAGTGLLGVALAPLVRSYTLTDVETLVPLIRKNVALNFPEWQVPGKPGSNVSIYELDWLAVHAAAPSFRHRLLPRHGSSLDLILVVDCVYHPSLLPALINTIDLATTPNKTAVLVIVELRAEDVIREFLKLWLSVGGWEIRRIGNLLEMTYVVWVGWKTS